MRCADAPLDNFTTKVGRVQHPIPLNASHPSPLTKSKGQRPRATSSISVSHKVTLLQSTLHHRCGKSWRTIAALIILKFGLSGGRVRGWIIFARSRRYHPTSTCADFAKSQPRDHPIVPGTPDGGRSHFSYMFLSHCYWHRAQIPILIVARLCKTESTQNVDYWKVGKTTCTY